MIVDMPETMFRFMVGDFRDAWDALATNPAPGLHRGNYMFGRQAMALLERASRLCASDATGAALRDLTTELERIESRYFTLLPGSCAADSPEFRLPATATAAPEQQLLHAIFDLVRQGHAHQYQQIVATLTDGKKFGMPLTGADHGLTIAAAAAAPRPVNNLAYGRDADGDLVLVIRTDRLFLDIEEAIKASRLLARGLVFEHLQRPRGNPVHYQFDTAGAEAALQAGGHVLRRI